MVLRVMVTLLLAVLIVGSTATCQEVEKPLKPAANMVKVIAPNGGEIWTANTAQTVLWELSSALVPDSIRIKLLRKVAGGPVTKDEPAAVKGDHVLVTIRRENPGKWEWEKVGPVGDGLRIQVEAFFPGKKTVRDASDKPFAIVAADIPVAVTPPTVKVLSPNGGEVWTVGSKQTIKWVAEPASEGAVSGTDVPQTVAQKTQLVKISLSRDGGTTWEILADRPDLTSSAWEWTIPDIVADKCRVRVTVLDKQLSEICRDISDADFQLVPSSMGEHPGEHPEH